ncbi:protein of unknown function DUF3361 [Trinorchestia longiramus]|nr:protein of unknown function DUF3361 [Trinorchestia longiramus]
MANERCVNRASAQDEGIIKLAVLSKGHDPLLLKYYTKKPWSDFISEVCAKFGIPNWTQYMLRYEGPPHVFVDEHNCHEIPLGAVLKLYDAPAVLSQKLVEGLSVGGGEKIKVLQDIQNFAKDPLFVKEFINNKGLQKLEELGLCDESQQWATDNPVLPDLVLAYHEVFNNSGHNWDECNKIFVERVCMMVATQIIIPDPLLNSCLIAVQTLCESKKYLGVLEISINIVRLVQHLTRAPRSRRAALTALVALFSNASGPEKKREFYEKLSERQNRNIIVEHVINNIDFKYNEKLEILKHEKNEKFHNNNPAYEAARNEHIYHHEMCCLVQQLQHLYLIQLRPRLMSGASQDDKAVDKILNFRNTAFQTDAEVTGANPGARPKEIKQEYKKLGFRSDNPVADFEEVPPGRLALDNIHYFCKQRQEQFSKLVLENCYRADSHECPIGRAAIEITKLLADILKIRELVTKDDPHFHTMLFAHDHPFEELFCICISLLNKTWKEMKATTEDFHKVMSVVREQIVQSLDQRPSNLDQFQERLQKLTYKTISEQWQVERKRTEELELNAPQILKLKEELRRDVNDVVQQQRLKVMEKGDFFKMPGKSRGREKQCYFMLSLNHKFFHYDDVSDKTNNNEAPSLESLTKKISVAELKSVLINKDCPHFNTRRKQQYFFSLMKESSKTEPNSVDLITSDETTFCHWVDGIKVLLREKMTSAEAVKDIEMLLELELKLQLLDLEGVAIPMKAPTLPPPPPNYNFCYNL